MYIYIYAYIYKYVYNCIHILQEKQSLCFLKAFRNIHLGPLRITFSSPFSVAGVGRSIITLFEIYYKILELLEGGNATGVRQSSMLGFYGERLCKRNETCSLFTVGSSIYLSHYTISYLIGHIQWPMVVSIPSFVGPQWCHARPAWQLPNTNENSSARAVPSTGGENSAHETLRRDGVEPGVRGTHRSQIWGVANGYPYIIHL